ncbi:hypothetical protein NEFER03_1623 [Nematocida sp. LUAm3]|nr:hypothetical protein NEFER03_1623 [Nematocida sp. LUAm3]KAI5179005.1 hypothetical protein NEFER01_1881 [Nematocida sp. LUAm1]
MVDKHWIECEYEACGRDRGSAVVTYAGTKILAVVNGPFEPSTKIIDPFKGIVRVHVAASVERRGECSMFQEALESIFSSSIQLNRYPRSVIEIKLYILSYSKYFLSAMINSVSCLLLGSGILMHNVPMGIYIDGESGVSTVSCVSRNQEVTSVFVYGEIDEKEEAWRREAPDLLERIRYLIKENYVSKWKNETFPFLKST